MQSKLKYIYICILTYKRYFLGKKTRILTENILNSICKNFGDKIENVGKSFSSRLDDEFKSIFGIVNASLDQRKLSKYSYGLSAIDRYGIRRGVRSPQVLAAA